VLYLDTIIHGALAVLIIIRSITYTYSRSQRRQYRELILGDSSAELSTRGTERPMLGKLTFYCRVLKMPQNIPSCAGVSRCGMTFCPRGKESVGRSGRSSVVADTKEFVNMPGWNTEESEGPFYECWTGPSPVRAGRGKVITVFTERAFELMG